MECNLKIPSDPKASHFGNLRIFIFIKQFLSTSNFIEGTKADLFFKHNKKFL